MTRYVALLRAINVGGKNRLPMNRLRELLTGLDYQNVRTYIQSGNILFETQESDEAAISGSIQVSIEEQFEIATPVILRRSDEFAKIVASSPFDALATAPDKLQVMFLSAIPDANRVANLEPDRSPGDSFVVQDREIYMHLPRGAARTKLTLDYFEPALGVTATARNWKTVNRLAEMIETV